MNQRSSQLKFLSSGAYQEGRGGGGEGGAKVVPLLCKSVDKQFLLNERRLEMKSFVELISKINPKVYRGTYPPLSIEWSGYT